MLLDPRNGERFDLPPFDGATRTYVIASLPRTGSTMFCRMLEATRHVGAPKEYLNPMQLRDWGSRLAPWGVLRWGYQRLHGPMVNLCGRGWWTEAALARYLDAIRARRTGSSGWFGLKLHRHHFRQWFTRRGWDAQRHLRAERWVFITRDDRVAQAVSWARAMQTGRWASHQRDAVAPVYSRSLIQHYLDRIDADVAEWDAWFDEQRIQPHRVTYERILADGEAEVRGVLRHLDVPHADEVEIPPPPTRRQSDPESEAWRMRFLLETSEDGRG